MANNENFAVNCRRPIRFVRNRRVNADPFTAPVVPGPSYHLSWVHSDAEVWEKISTWGHADDMVAPRWFERKWKRWTPSARCLAPGHSSATYWRAVRFEGELPEELAELVNPPHDTESLDRSQTLAEWAASIGALCFYHALLVWGSIRRALGGRL